MNSWDAFWQVFLETIILNPFINNRIFPTNEKMLYLWKKKNQKVPSSFSDMEE